MRLSRAFFEQNTIAVAKSLLGLRLCRREPDGSISTGLIVETEAYLGIEDAACHAFRGRRGKKNESLYLEGGHWYVYHIHRYKLLNLVTKEKDNPQAVLIRAIQAIDSQKEMEKNRGVLGIEVGNGPGKLTIAMEIGMELDKQALHPEHLTILESDVKPKAILSRARIGINCEKYWKEKPLCFYVAKHPCVSRIPKKETKPIKECWIKE